MRTLLITLLFLFPVAASAAEFQITGSDTVHAGDTFVATVSLNTGADTVNAVEGVVRIPENLTLSSVRLSGSLVPLWVSPPEVSDTAVTFAGVLPGGFQGTGVLFTLVLRAEKAGTVALSFNADAKAYSNDGNGTEVPLTLRSLTVSVGESSGTPREANIALDATLPEQFTPIFASGEPFGEEGAVLVFSTQDKDSGVLRYDIAASFDKHANVDALSWQEVNSPYALTSNDVGRFIFVRAVDYDGNARVAMVPPQTFSVFAFVASWWMLIVGAALLIVILSMRFLKRR
jgi:hypothetical protein